MELITEKMAFEGKAIARQGRYVIFVEGALPGERVEAVLTQKKRQFAFARVERVLDASPDRRAPDCPRFGACGGCNFRFCDYPTQLRIKQDVFHESMHGVPLPPEGIHPILGVENPEYYRNKMVFTFGRDHAGETVLGLHRRNNWREIIPAEICRLASPESNEIQRRTLAFVKAKGIEPFDDIAKTGIVRTLMVREGKATGRRMVVLGCIEFTDTVVGLADELGALADTVLVGADRRVEGPPIPVEYRLLKGSGIIEERLNDLVFEIGPDTFFQTNTLQAGHLFRALVTRASELKPKLTLDLYCGTGPVGLHLARVSERVLGMESVEACVQAARRNAVRNQITNIEFLSVAVEKAGGTMQALMPDLVVVDPPRAGLHPKAMKLLRQQASPHIFYISCNPATLARDLKLLCEDGYRVESLQPVDMFPHTFHVEALATLCRQ